MSTSGTTIDFDAAIRALAHPFRRKVLQWLVNPDEYFTEAEYCAFRCVSAGMLHARSGLSQSTVSGHLSQLERAGLIKTQKVGQWVFFSRNEDTIRALAEWLCADIARISERV
ncbi:helix-turn-helix transcriptional regulator [Paraburkholderia caribensis]|uniref:Transcriptional regulator n=1 Tax=Paraburkholderia caribensis TaxID=75105 RepID=A0A9Q6SB48_9BURK|nr:helix-turn-helix transcriptional regulator [Paraburkholderia caribensis]MCO4879710.1 ArsR family transcriptional regulator [Paraburkholderia caribensis]PTB26742.1 transcriptional regulator [Paraburkholderia caribensis]QLB67646.1 transcriptional regulator [Paraburkholderia caribensis]